MRFSHTSLLMVQNVRAYCIQHTAATVQAPLSITAILLGTRISRKEHGNGEGPRCRTGIIYSEQGRHLELGKDPDVKL